MESRQISPGMKGSASIIKGLKTQTEQNLAAALLVSLMKQKPKRKRKEKSA
jgi:hypothetical protein